MRFWELILNCISIIATILSHRAVVHQNKLDIRLKLPSLYLILKWFDHNGIFLMSRQQWCGSIEEMHYDSVAWIWVIFNPHLGYLGVGCLDVLAKLSLGCRRLRQVARPCNCTINPYTRVADSCKISPILTGVITSTKPGLPHTIYHIKEEHGLVVHCLVVVMLQFVADLYNSFNHILRACFAGILSVEIY